jgi:membrane-associated protease RseP (regulator of RpoE activity)
MLAIFLVAWVIIYIISRIFSLEKFGIEIHPLYLLYRTERFNKFLENLATRRPRLLRTFWNIAVAVAVGEMIFAIYLLSQNLLNFLFEPQSAQRIFLLLPGVTVSLRWFPYLLVAIGLAIVAHEMAHGLASYLERIKTDSVGLILTPITFGAFVEPNEDQLKKSSIFSKLRVISSGSLSNLIFGIIILLLITGLFSHPTGILIINMNKEGPAYDSGIREWDVIKGMNGTNINNTYDFYLYMSKVTPGETILIETNHGERTVTTISSIYNSSYPVLGIGFIDYLPLRFEPVGVAASYHIFQTLNWVSTLMINLAVFNMLPLYPLDGDLFIYSIVEHRLKDEKKSRLVRIILSIFILTLMATNIGFSFLKYGFAPI